MYGSPGGDIRRTRETGKWEDPQLQCLGDAAVGLVLADYMVRSVKGIERLSNLTCISYAAVQLLPYYSSEFKEYQGQSPQKIRYQLV